MRQRRDGQEREGDQRRESDERLERAVAELAAASQAADAALRARMADQQQQHEEQAAQAEVRASFLRICCSCPGCWNAAVVLETRLRVYGGSLLPPNISPPANRT